MKSFADLNAKWWYRLVKVLYGTFFLLIALVSAVAVFRLNETYQAPNYLITCNYGNQSVFNTINEKNVSIADYNPYKEVPATMDKQILATCGITQAGIDQANAKATASQLDNEKSCINIKPTDLFAEYTCTHYIPPYQTSSMYNIVTATTPVHTYIKAVIYTALDLLIVLCLFEILRRSFYYVVLGKIKPLTGG
jgi:hypothetical protein